MCTPDQGQEPTTIAAFTPDMRRPFCGVDESVLAHMEELRGRGIVAKWLGTTHFRVAIRDRLTGIDPAVFNAIFKRACDQWEAVCGVSFEFVAMSAPAELIVLTRAIDGNGGTLAETELPNGVQDQPLRMWIDKGDRWWADPLFGPPPSNLVALLPVLCHELGHFLGLGHETTRQIVALLDPYYDPEVTRPRPWDINEAVLRYGPPKAVKPPPTPPAEAAPPRIDMTVTWLGQSVPYSCQPTKAFASMP